MLSRGYLWTDLTSEVGILFASLAQIDAGELFDAGNYFIGSLSTWQTHARVMWLEDDKALPADVLSRLRDRRWEVVVERRREQARGMTPAEKARVLRARRALEGRCVECERKREPNNSRCDAHIKRLAEYKRRKRAEKQAGGAK